MLRVRPAVLASSYDKVRSQLLRLDRNGRRTWTYFERLSEADRKYLMGWFSEDALARLDEVSLAIECLDNESIRNFMRVSLSNILRRVSWQKDDDLRVRKEVRLVSGVDPKREYLEQLERSTKTLLAFLTKNGSGPVGSDEIIEGDARRCAEMWAKYFGTIDAVITSPPYATSLPYLDTDRLSLIYLGLLPRPQHRVRDQEMIGNREITERIRREYWDRFASDGNTLPTSVQTVISRIHELNSSSDVGFRRKNLSALLVKYFFDMSEVLNGIWKALKPGGRAFMVVGNNHTVAGGHRVEIRTASYLTDIARRIDFEVLETIPMDMLVSRDIFKRNAVKSEDILSLRKPSQQ
jgi:site-specific DNA-methyltransferase (cytosine-N4-specific)